MLNAPLRFILIMMTCLPLSPKTARAQQAQVLLAPITVRPHLPPLGQFDRAVTSYELGRYQAKNPIDILKLNTSIHLRENGGKIAPSIRGSRNNAVLIFQDGLLLNDPSLSGEADLSSINISRLSSTEVHTGAEALFDHPSALGGTIHFKSPSYSLKKKANLKPFKGSIEVGSQQLIDARLEGSVQHNCTAIQGALMQQQSGKGSIPDRTTGKSTSDHSRSQTQHMTIDHFLAENTGLTLRIDHGESQTRLSQYIAPDTYENISNKRHSDRHQIAMCARQKLPRKGYRHSASLAHTEIKSRFNQQKIFKYKGNRTYAHYLGKMKIDPEKTLEMHYEHENEQATSAVLQQTRLESSINRIKAKYAQKLPGWRLRYFLSSVLEHHQRFGSQLHYQVGMNYQLAKTVTLFASHGTGHRNPNFVELLGTAFSPANLTLKAERARALEMGVETTNAKQTSRLRCTYFQTQHLRPLTFDPKTFQSINGQKNHRSGFEISHAWQPYRWYTIHSSYTKIQVASSYPGSTRAPFSPSHHALIALSLHPLDKLSFFSTLRRTGQQRGISRTISTSHDLRFGLEYQASSQLKIHGRIENALDQRREEYPGYGRRGMGVIIGMTCQI